MEEISIDKINPETMKNESQILFSKKVQEIKDSVFQDFAKYFDGKKDLIIVNGEDWNKLREKHGFKTE